MSEQLFQYLLNAYLTGEATVAEKRQLGRLLEEAPYRQLLEARLDKELISGRYEQGDDYAHLFEKIYGQIEKQITVAPQPVIRQGLPQTTRWWWAAAAAVLLIVAGSFWWHAANPVNIAIMPVAQDIQPGSRKAVLTLADGQQVTLDSAGHLEMQQGNTAVQQQGDQLLYAAGSAGAAESFNTLVTPRGGRFRVTLPDGSRVWLNAASSLRYPISFSGKERKVTLTGEAYFEVAAMASKPFLVDVDQRTTVLVLGTKFNINAYTEEKEIQTTLLDGAVSVNAAEQRRLLSPGQQARWKDGHLIVIKDADTEQATAWKNGRFSFTDADLPAVMRQLARWYDVDVVYEGKVPERAFNGEIGQDLTLTQVMDLLGNARVKYKIEGRKIIIQP